MDYLGELLGRVKKSKGRPKTEKHALADEIWAEFKLSDKREYQIILGMIRNVGIKAIRDALNECRTRKMPYPYLKGIYKNVYKETWKSNHQTDNEPTQST